MFLQSFCRNQSPQKYVDLSFVSTNMKNKLTGFVGIDFAKRLQKLFVWDKRISRRPPRGTGPHGGVRPFHQKSTCLTQLSLGPCMVQIWPRCCHFPGERKPRTSPCGTSEPWCDAFPHQTRMPGTNTLALPQYSWTPHQRFYFHVLCILLPMLFCGDPRSNEAELAPAAEAGELQERKELGTLAIERRERSNRLRAFEKETK